MNQLPDAAALSTCSCSGEDTKEKTLKTTSSSQVQGLQRGDQRPGGDECVCVCVPERERDERTELRCDLLEMLRLTCSVAQSDLQGRERNQPAELEGVRVAVGVRRPGVGLVVASKGGRVRVGEIRLDFSTPDTIWVV